MTFLVECDYLGDCDYLPNSIWVIEGFRIEGIDSSTIKI